VCHRTSLSAYIYSSVVWLLVRYWPRLLTVDTQDFFCLRVDRLEWVSAHSFLFVFFLFERNLMHRSCSKLNSFTARDGGIWC
jgi:hypothetical protein